MHEKVYERSVRAGFSNCVVKDATATEADQETKATPTATVFGLRIFGIYGSERNESEMSDASGLEVFVLTWVMSLSWVAAGRKRSYYEP